MRKQIIESSVEKNVAATPTWLDLKSLAQVQVSSEQATNPIELALMANHAHMAHKGPGWLAAQSGQQTVRLLFDTPQRITLIHLLFRETQQDRTQEFVLRYSKDRGVSYHEILRQQYNFSPPSTSIQLEEYKVQLEQITTLELTIIPDINGGSAPASLAELKLA